MFTSFDDAIRAAGARAEATAAEFEAMRDKARELGRTSGFTATQVANLMGELGQAGFKPDQINEMTEAVLNLARASNTDAAVSAQILAVGIKTYGLAATDAAHVSDLLAAASNRSMVNLTDLGESFKHVAPEARRLGMSMEDTLAVLMGLSEFGIRGEMAGTTMRRLGTLSAAGSEGLQRLFGVAGADLAGKARPLVDVLDDVSKSIEGLGTAEATKRLDEFFGLLGITAAAAIGKGAAGIRDFRAGLGSVTGYAENAAKKMNAGLGGSLRFVVGAALDAAIAFGDALAPSLMLVGAAIVGAMNELSAFMKQNAEAAAAIGATVVALVALALTAGVAGLAMKGFGVVLAVLKIPVLLLAAAFAVLKLAMLAVVSLPVLVGALAVGIVLAAARASGALSTLGDTFRAVGSIAAETMGGIMAAIKKGDIGLAFQILTTGLHAGWLELIIGLRQAWNQFVNYFRDAFADAVLSIRTAFLDMLIAVIDGINDIGKQKRKLANQSIEVPLTGPGAPAEIQAINKQMDDIRSKRPVAPAAGAGLDEFVKWSKQVEAADKELTKLSEKRMRAADKIIAGGQWIDTEKFHLAKEMLADLDKQERDARNKGQEERLNAIREERDAKLKALREMIDFANREVGPMPREAGLLPVAPMPRAAGRALEAQLGDAARGLFQSADFSGSLAIGPAAKDLGRAQLDTLKSIDTRLGRIEQNGGLVFT